MDKTQYYIKIDKNINSINAIENDLSTLQYAMYKKSVDSIKQIKLQELKEYLETQCEYFGQKTYSFKDELNQIYEEYEFQMKRITNVYDKMFVDVLKILKNSYNNQKISISNIITIDNQYNNTDFLTPEKIKELNKIKKACAQKKVNYSVIVRECKARINWIIENVQKDLMEIFDNKDIVNVIGIGDKKHKIKNEITDEVVEPKTEEDKNGNVAQEAKNIEQKEEKLENKENNKEETSLEKKKESQLASAVNESMLARFFRFINNLINGNSYFKRVLNEYQSDYLLVIKNKVDVKTADIAATIAGVTKMLEQAKNKINDIYIKSTKSN